MLATPLGIFLQALYSVIGNYALSLILMTVIIKLALYPSYKQQMASTSGMRELQPRINDIQTKYANDRALMNQKIQELYKEEGVSPTAGCLPMIVQMIVIMGLFSLLRNPIMFMNSENMVFAIHESFLWIEDLAQPDPWILPLLAGIATFVASFLQQKTSPSPQSNAVMSAMMKYLFPLMIVWLARSYPAGLAMYWFISQFLQIFFTLGFYRSTLNKGKSKKKKKKPVRAGEGVQ